MFKSISKYPIVQLITLFLISAAIKILLIPAYFSTDFDVHQNWLRITHTKPMSQWYFDSQSKWTLDYPPFFAYFEWFLAKISTIIDPLISANINKHLTTIYFQRATVIFSQIPYLIVLYYIIKQINYKLIISYFSISFLILDNIHFQYNIIMQAIFILSVYLIIKEDYLKGAFVYACLLNFKHIYLYSGIAFLAYILKHYVLKPQSFTHKITNLIKVGTVTIIPFILSFSPFIISGGFQQITQIISRLFPFQRGLIHEYWAPNFWALYHFADKLINLVFARFFISSGIQMKQLSGDLHNLKILPQISPFVTTLLVLLVTVPIIIKLINYDVKFDKLVFICGMTFFMFGFHVHEKAITPYISLLFIFLEFNRQNQNRSFENEAIFVNIVNLIPLLIGNNQKLLKILLPLLSFSIWDYRKDTNSIFQGIIYSSGFTIILYHEMIHPLIKSNRLQFVPLMLNSVYAATFNICWLSVLYYREIKSKTYMNDKQNNQYVELPNNSES